MTSPISETPGAIVSAVAENALIRKFDTLDVGDSMAKAAKKARTRAGSVSDAASMSKEADDKPADIV